MKIQRKGYIWDLCTILAKRDKLWRSNKRKKKGLGLLGTFNYEKVNVGGKLTEDKSCLVRFVMQTQVGAFSVYGSSLVVQSPSSPGTGKEETPLQWEMYTMLWDIMRESTELFLHLLFIKSLVTKQESAALCPWEPKLWHWPWRVIYLLLSSLTGQRRHHWSLSPHPIWGQDRFHGLWRTGWHEVMLVEQVSIGRFCNPANYSTRARENTKESQYDGVWSDFWFVHIWSRHQIFLAEGTLASPRALVATLLTLQTEDCWFQFILRTRVAYT